jgi:hypothetical protein
LDEDFSMEREALASAFAAVCAIAPDAAMDADFVFAALLPVFTTSAPEAAAGAPAPAFLAGLPDVFPTVAVRAV